MKCIKCKTQEAMKDATMCLECAKSVLRASLGLSDAEIREHKKDTEAEAKSS